MLVAYGVVRRSHPGVAEPGLRGAPVMAVDLDDLAVLVTPVPDDDELLARRRDVATFMSVVERAAAAGDVLPFRFGTVFAHETQVRDALAARGDDYASLLDRLGGLVQVTVKAVRSDDDAVRAAVAADEGLRRWVAARAGSAALADRMAAGERVAAAVAELDERDAAEIVARLSPIGRAVATERSAGATVAAVALLVDPADLPRVDQAVAALHDDFGDRMTFDYAGPMPPYSFVSG